MLEGGMFHTASVELALTMIAAARSRAWLASAIRRSTRRPELASWVVEFLRYPRWSQFCEVSEITDDVGASFIAHAESHHNAAIGAESHDSLFWDRLTRDDAAHGVVDSPLSHLNDALAAEVSAWAGPPEPAPLPEHWRLLVEREALRQTTFKQALQIEVVTAEVVESFVSSACRLAEWELGAEVGVWIGEANGRRGVGAVSSSSVIESSRSHFEQRHTPWYFRQSIELNLDVASKEHLPRPPGEVAAAAGGGWAHEPVLTTRQPALAAAGDSSSLIAVVYSSVAVDGLEDWSAALAKARAVEQMRPLVVEHASVDDEVEARYWSAVAEFGAGAGHTINNPLGAIAGLAERLLDGEHKPDRRASLHKIRTQVDRIHRMIRDLHLLGRHAKSADGVASLREAIGQGVAKAAARFVDRQAPRCSVAEIPPEAQVPLALVDAARLVEELVANAIDAAGSQGFVEVQTIATASGVEIRVVDSGPGFSASELANAFSPFFAGRSAGRGLGMGLPVCRRIAERAGGRLAVRRTRPTTVVVQLPLAAAAASRRAA